MPRPIEEHFGERVIQAFADFARADLKPPADLARDEFAHVSDISLRTALAQVFYGVRWIYKLGLALLVRDEERAAHVRAQIVDYASVCEALLSYCIAHAVRNGYTSGLTWRFADPDTQKRPISWDPTAPERALRKQTLWWLIRIAREFAIISTPLAGELDWLREQRNTVHLRERASLGKTAFLNQSKRAFTLTTRLLVQTKTWKGTHP
jgi:hypothetical protein